MNRQKKIFPENKGRWQEFGHYGERVALEFLEKEGYRILEKNYRCQLGEIDLIARDKNIIAFIEIKSRQGLNFGSPQEAVTHHKQRQIVKVALHYLKQKHLFRDRLLFRFDVVSISPGGIELIKDAFSSPAGYTY